MEIPVEISSQALASAIRDFVHRKFKIKTDPSSRLNVYPEHGRIAYYLEGNLIPHEAGTLIDAAKILEWS